MSFFGLFGSPNVEKMKLKRDLQGLSNLLTYKYYLYEELSKAKKRLEQARNPPNTYQDPKAAKAYRENKMRSAQDKIDRITSSITEASIIRASAAEALGELGDRLAIKTLVDILDDKESIVRSAVATALAKLCQEDIEPLVLEIKKEQDVGIRKQLIEIISRIAHPQRIPALSATLADPNVEVVVAGAWALARLKDVNAVEPLMNVLSLPKIGNNDYSSDYVKTEVVKALGQFGDSRVVQPLTTQLSTRDTRLRTAIYEVLRQIIDISAVSPLLKKYQYGFPNSYHVDSSDVQELETVIKTLEKIFEQKAGEIQIEDLQAIVQVPDTIHWHRPDTIPQNCMMSNEESGFVSGSYLKQLARQELIRRGEQA